MIPIRCMSCGKPVSAYFEEFQARKAEGETPQDVFDDMNIKRYCCRRMFITHVEVWK
ncbi:MAG: DNA-directed RNA polymerase subunit N [Methanobrevibacter sp.]|jgi:DNA-directed RNA polymerase subunit N|nr:DNA-directed RNA polymerase subunit N [Candidatus Methanovirga basalitermitum]